MAQLSGDFSFPFSVTPGSQQQLIFSVTESPLMSVLMAMLAQPVDPAQLTLDSFPRTFPGSRLGNGMNQINEQRMWDTSPFLPAWPRSVPPLLDQTQARSHVPLAAHPSL